MQERGTEGTSALPVSARRWPDALALGVLLLVGLAIHAWTIGHTAVIARDTIGYIKYALMLEQLPWNEALPRLEQHPLYPLSVLAMALPVRHLQGDGPETMVLASQLASSLAGILLVIPLFYLGCELFERRIAFWGTALFQCLPMVAQVTSDGLSDGLFLLMLTAALLAAVQAVQQRSVVHFGLSGLATGLAYLARPEGALVAIAALLVLGIMQARAVTRWPWRRALTGAASLLAGAAVMAGPYMAVIGAVTVKPGALKLLNNVRPTDTLGELFQPGEGEEARRTTPLATGAPLLAACSLAVWWMDEQRGMPPPWWWGAKTLLVETGHALAYLGWVPALLALGWYPDPLRRPGTWVVLVLCGLVSLLLIRVAVGIHYLSERHTLVLAMCISLWAGAGLVRIADRLPGWLAMLLRRPLAPRLGGVIAGAWLLVSVAWCLPTALKPLHANRMGHREAGRWLAANAGPADPIIDPFCWAHFYSGRFLSEPRPGDPMAKFVVLTHSNNPHGRLSGIDKARQLAEQGSMVFRWTPTPVERKRYRAEEVLVYAVPLGATEASE